MKQLNALGARRQFFGGGPHHHHHHHRLRPVVLLPAAACSVTDDLLDAAHADLYVTAARPPPFAYFAGITTLLYFHV